MAAIYCLVTLSPALSLDAHKENSVKETTKYPVHFRLEYLPIDDVRRLLPGIDLPERYNSENADGSKSEESFSIDYAIGQYDLDEDGKPEIFLYISGINLCGSLGCNLQIYQKLNDEMSPLLPEGGITAYDAIGIWKNKKLNYHDIELFSGFTSAIWTWNGKEYNFKHKVK